MEELNLARVIQDPGLQRFAESDDKHVRSVIVEAKTSTLRVSKVKSACVSRRDVESYTLIPDSNRAIDARSALAVIRDHVRNLKLVEKPVVLEGAHAIVVSVTPAQLRSLAAMPEVAIIRPNRNHAPVAP